MVERISVRDVRNANRENIIRSLIANKCLKKSELASMNHISVVTVTNITEDLISRGVIQETRVDSEVGRKPVVLSLRSDLGCIVTLALSSRSSMRYKIYNIHRETLDEGERYLSDGESYNEALLEFIKLIQVRMQLVGADRVLGVGASVPGVYEPSSGIVLTELVPELRTVRLKDLLREAFQCAHVIVEHDVHLASLAERKHMKYDPKENNALYYLYIGEGIGGAIAMGSNASYLGYNSIAGDAGQLLVADDRGQVRNLESLLSTVAIVEQVRGKRPHVRSLDDVIDMYENGDALVRGFLDRIFMLLSRVVYNIAWLLNPEVIVIGSTNSRLSELTADILNDSVGKMFSGSIPVNCVIRASALNDLAFLIGAYESVITSWIDGL